MVQRAAAEPDPHFRGGRGEPVLLLHGLLLTWQSWGAVIDELSGDHDVFAPTLPGHWGGPAVSGPATFAALADFVVDVMDENDWPTAHLVGNSLGGWLALELAARGRARSVVAIAPGGLWDAEVPATKQLIRKYRAFGPVLGVGAGAAAPKMVRSLVIPLLAHRPAAVPHALATACAAAPAHCHIVDDLARDPALTTGFTALAEIDVPVTVLLCEHDRLLPSGFQGRGATAPGIDSRTLPGVGHVPMLEAPDLVTTEIRSALARAVPRKRG
ncbi:alpha/beta fold hydrolase [Nocardia macrotermitis]|uniref:2-succinyl-6-hydroxy-2, 4-cyclohexadiene-1-carboxylate synthase n=1 Tax=Nocardia macrotermitis TaxID=2585198 RepID=A0A7K0DCQ7_9NOCA|nr:alpha/beta fold hydrolase [Nocardia macrotermitis]MQY23507.1 2-succinyl-6-hydroxy-2,4-cyclohexadiene-1-carboxylate synthase [Nocardia macrotermitis]